MYYERWYTITCRNAGGKTRLPEETHWRTEEKAMYCQELNGFV